MSSKYCLLTLETNFDTNIKLEIKKNNFKSCFSFITYFQSNNVGMLIENRKTTFLIYVTKYVNRDYYTGLLLLFRYHLKNICTAQQHVVSLFTVNLCIIVCVCIIFEHSFGHHLKPLLGVRLASIVPTSRLLRRWCSVN